MMADFYWMLQHDVPKKKHTAGNQLKEVSSQSVKDAILIRNKKFCLILNQELPIINMLFS
jgi:hypothetical protein